MCVLPETGRSLIYFEVTAPGVPKSRRFAFVLREVDHGGEKVGPAKIHIDQEPIDTRPNEGAEEYATHWQTVPSLLPSYVLGRLCSQ